MKKTRWTAPLTAIAIPMMMMFLATVPISAEGITLQEALRQVRSDNPTIRSTHEQLRVTEEGVREARSALLPNLTARGEYTVYGKETLVTPMSEPPTPQSDPLSFDDRIYSGALRLDVPILDLSALSLIGAARHEIEHRRSRSAETDQAILAFSADHGLRIVSGPSAAEQSRTVRITLHGDMLRFEVKGGDSWMLIDMQSRRGLEGDPAKLRLGKLAEDGSWSDYSGAGGKSGRGSLTNLLILSK